MVDGVWLVGLLLCWVHGWVHAPGLFVVSLAVAGWGPSAVRVSDPAGDFFFLFCVSDLPPLPLPFLSPPFCSRCFSPPVFYPSLPPSLLLVPPVLWSLCSFTFFPSWCSFLCCLVSFSLFPDPVLFFLLRVCCVSLKQRPQGFILCGSVVSVSFLFFFCFFTLSL